MSSLSTTPERHGHIRTLAVPGTLPHPPEGPLASHQTSTFSFEAHRTSDYMRVSEAGKTKAGDSVGQLHPSPCKS